MSINSDIYIFEAICKASWIIVKYISIGKEKWDKNTPKIACACSFI